MYSTEPFKNFHYWLLSESTELYRETMRRAEKYRKEGSIDDATAVVSNFYKGTMNIKPIVYKKNEHIFLEKLFQKLIDSLPVTLAAGKVSGTPVR